MEFFQTQMGKRFFEGHIPKLIGAIEKGIFHGIFPWHIPC